MPKTKISEFSATPGNNTDIDGINLAEGCAPSGINDAIRELMAQLKDFQAGTAGDSFNGPVGTTTAAAGAFTNLSASGTFALTGDQVQISEGGTGQTTANAAFNALAPSQATHAGKYLKTDGTNTSWDALDISTADITGTLPVANGGTGVTSSTGTGSVVLSASPTFTGTVNAAALTLSSNFTLSGGTANGVAYLNGSKVLTTGSALSFDGTNFRAVSNARIEGTGVGITGSGDGAEIYSNSGITYFQGLNRTSLTYIPIVLSGGTYIAQTLGGSEQARLTSTGLGIGTSSPAGTLDVVGARSYFRSSGALGTAIRIVSTFTNGRDWGIGSNFAAGNGEFAIYDYTAAATRLTLDSSGNLGLGVTPSDSSSFGRTLDISGGAAQGAAVYVRAAASSTNYLALAQDTSNNSYLLNRANGAMLFYTNNTERARITSGGNLLVKTTADNGVTCHFNGGANANIIRLTGASTTNSGYIGMDGDNFTISTGASILERARITSGGNLLVGTTSNSGSATNAAQVVGGVFSTTSGTASITSGTPVTLFAIPQGSAFFVTIRSSNAGADDGVSTYIAQRDNNGVYLTAIKTNTGGSGRLWTLQVSTTNIQGVNSTGTETAAWSAIRIS